MLEMDEGGRMVSSGKVPQEDGKQLEHGRGNKVAREYLKLTTIAD